MPSGVPDPGEVDRTTLAVRHAIGGDAPSLDWLLHHFTPVLMASARQRIGPGLRARFDPEDLVQQVWAIALPRLTDLEPREGRYTPVLLRFLASVMWRCHANLLRRHLQVAAPVPLHESALADSTTGAITRAIREEDTARLLAGLDRLTEAEREVVILRGIEQTPNHEVALLLGAPPNTIAQRYRRALDKLRAIVPGTALDEID